MYVCLRPPSSGVLFLYLLHVCRVYMFSLCSGAPVSSLCPPKKCIKGYLASVSSVWMSVYVPLCPALDWHIIWGVFILVPYCKSHRIGSRFPVTQDRIISSNNDPNCIQVPKNSKQTHFFCLNYTANIFINANIISTTVFYKMFLMVFSVPALVN